MDVSLAIMRETGETKEAFEELPESVRGQGPGGSCGDGVDFLPFPLCPPLGLGFKQSSF